jgi:hypothetical protein
MAEKKVRKEEKKVRTSALQADVLDQTVLSEIT